MGRSLLTLDTMEPDRDFIVIDGNEFYLREQDELSLSEIARIRHESKAVVGIGAEAGEEDMKKVEQFVADIITTVVIGMTGPLLDKLTTAQKLQIVSAFTAVTSSKRARAETGKEGSQPTTDGSSRGSDDSTEAASQNT